MHYRKILLILISILFLFIFGCSAKIDNGEQNIDITNGIQIDASNEIVINSLCTGNVLDCDIASWQSYIYDNYGYEIDYRIINVANKYSNRLYDTADDMGNATNEKLEKVDANGLYFLDAHSYIVFNNLIMNNNIIPLNDYVIGNSAWEALPLAIKESFIDKEGNIWAIPFNCEPAFRGRKYVTTWLSKFNAEIPKNINELYELFKNFTYQDPDRNGLNDTTGQTYLPGYPIAGFTDVFDAYDCSISKEIATPYIQISFNNDENIFEDSMLKPNMENALTFIKSLIDEKIISNNKYIRAGSSSAGSLTYDTSLYTYSYSLTEEKNKNITPVNDGYYSGYYVLAKNTENPQSVVRNFLNLFYNDIDGHLIAQYGIKDKNYTFDGFQVELLNDESYESMPYINGVLSNVVEENYEYTDRSIMDDYYIRQTYYDEGKRLDTMYSLLYSKNVFSYLDNETKQGYNELYIKMCEVFRSKMYIYTTEDISAQEIISNYLLEYKKNDFQELIDYLNDAFHDENGFNQ